MKGLEAATYVEALNVALKPLNIQLNAQELTTAAVQANYATFNSVRADYLALLSKVDTADKLGIVYDLGAQLAVMCGQASRGNPNAALAFQPAQFQAFTDANELAPIYVFLSATLQQLKSTDYNSLVALRILWQQEFQSFLPASPPVRQDNWQFCTKCQGLFFAGNGNGVCPSALNEVGHQSGDSGGAGYILSEGAGVQPNWRWCHKCQGLFFAGNGNGVCPAGKGHDSTNSADYALSPGGLGQSNWQWCTKCQGLFYNGNGSNGVCPKDGPPNPNGPGHADNGNETGGYTLAR